MKVIFEADTEEMTVEMPAIPEAGTRITLRFQFIGTQDFYCGLAHWFEEDGQVLYLDGMPVKMMGEWVARIRVRPVKPPESQS
jgi:hypothetical protein